LEVWGEQSAFARVGPLAPRSGPLLLIYETILNLARIPMSYGV